jgi:hypothetical protein
MRYVASMSIAIFFIIIIIFLTSPIAVITTNANAQEQEQQQQQHTPTIEAYLPYQNDDLGFKVQYPSNWQLKEPTAPERSFDPDYPNPILDGNFIIEFDSPNNIPSTDFPDGIMTI